MPANEASAKVQQLEHAIKRMDSLKKHLKQNASDAKAEIHANISQNLERLRGREVSLLGQVDQVLQAKEATLQDQHARLNQALGVLRTGLTVDATSEKHLTDTLGKLKRLELSPEETPYISFRANHMNLRESILNYGQVDGNGLPLLMAFDDPGKPSLSLPRSIEDYEDVDHHVFHKPLNMGLTSPSSISVQIPKLSTRFEDWLQKKVPAADSKPRSDMFLPKPQPPASLPAQLKPDDGCFSLGVPITPSPASSGSLSNWLSLIKDDVDMEEEPQYGITQRSCPQEASCESQSSTAKSRLALPDKKDLNKWLYQGSGDKSSSSSSGQTPTDSRGNIWLQQSQEKSTSLDALKRDNFFLSVSKDPSTWLSPHTSCGGRQYVTSSDCQVGTDLFSHISRDKESWLHKQNKACDPVLSKNTDKCGGCKKSCTSDTGKWLLSNSAVDKPAFQLEDVCQANEPCEKMSECVSQPDCLTLRFRENCSVKNLIDPTKAFKPLNLPLQEWLSPKSQKQKYCSANTQGDKQASDLFQHIPDVSNSVWLMRPCQNHSSPSNPIRFKDSKEEANLWLQKTSSSNTSESSSPSSVKTSPGCAGPMEECASDWLLVCAEDKEKQQEMCEHDKDSEGWSICSDSHITTSDQQASDIAFAYDYLNKWLLKA